MTTTIFRCASGHETRIDDDGSAAATGIALRATRARFERGCDQYEPTGDRGALERCAAAITENQEG